MNVDFGLPKRRDIKVAKYAPQMGLRDCSASRADRGPSNAGRFARPTTLSVRARHPVKHVLKSRRQRAIVLRCNEQQRIRDGDLRFYALHRTWQANTSVESRTELRITQNIERMPFAGRGRHCPS